MAYTAETQIKPEVRDRERELLLSGLSYKQVAAITGQREKTISERNRLIHKINIQAAFARRIERDGIPNRLDVDPAFGHWFSGFFDGEGCVGLFMRERGRYWEYRLFVSIMLRDDDARVIKRIHNNLKVGRIHRQPRRQGVNPAIGWRTEKVSDLAEVIIPLFDNYPLQSKKREQLAIWKPIVRSRYIRTLAGYSNRWPTPLEDERAFKEARERIREIGTYPV